MLGVYTDCTFLYSTGLFAAGILFTIFARRNRVLLWLSFLMMSAPFAWPAIYLLRESDPSERADRLLALWPLVLVLSLVAGFFHLKGPRKTPLILPFILIPTAIAASMSQKLWVSTYAFCPL